MKKLRRLLSKFSPSSARLTYPIEPTDTIVGTLPDYLRRLKAAADAALDESNSATRGLGDELQRLSSEHESTCGMPGHGDDECNAYKRRFEEIKSQIQRHQAKPQGLMDLFWALLRFEFDLWGVQSIGYRQGGKVVTSPAAEKAPGNPLGALHVDLGGGMPAGLEGLLGMEGIEHLLGGLRGAGLGGLGGIPVMIAVRSRSAESEDVGGNGGNEVPSGFPGFAIHATSAGGNGGSARRKR